MPRDKRFFDIIPPYFLKNKESAPFPENSNLFKRKVIIGGSILFTLIFIGLFCHFVLSKAKIEVYPKTEILNFREKITIDAGIDWANFSEKIIPGKIFEEIKDVQQEFPATDKTKKETRAKGTIKIYNEYNPPAPMTLVAQTRFLSETEKCFYSPKKIYIPKAKIQNKKIIPGQTEIEVIAMEPGKDYNISPAKFSIPGLAGTPYYFAVWGESFSPMKGGFIGETRKVSQNNLEEARDVLTKRALEESRLDLQNKISSEFILLDDAFFQEVIESSFSRQPDEEAESFNVKIRVKSKAMAFKKSSLLDFAKNYILSEISKDSVLKQLQPESLEISYSPQSIDLDSGKINLILDFSGKTFFNIVPRDLKQKIQGKSINEAILILMNDPGIKKVEIKPWPFWLKKIPEQMEKIEIELNLK